MPLFEIIGLYVVMSRTRFRVNPHSLVALMLSKNSLLEAGAKYEV